MVHIASARQLGPLESRIMELLWKHEGTVRSVADLLSGDKHPAYTTVMTVMVRLADKGLLTRRLTGRAYVYRPAQTKEQFFAGLSQVRVRELVESYGELALAQFVQEIEKADPRQLERLKALLSKKSSR